MRRMIAPAVLVMSALACLGAPAVANAASAPVTSSTQDVGDVTDPAVLDKIAELEASGVEIISVSDPVPYVTETADGDAAVRAQPSGCWLTVIISKSGLYIDGGSITSCNDVFSTGTMSSTMTHYNPDFGVWDSTVAIGSDQLAIRTIMTVDVGYNCNNANASNYRLVSTGQLYMDGTSYSAAAYDTFDTNVACGT